MRAPSPHRLTYATQGGEIIFYAFLGATAEPVTLARAAELHRWHLVELLRAARAGDTEAADFHKRLQGQLCLAIAAVSEWRRAGAPERRAA